VTEKCIYIFSCETPRGEISGGWYRGSGLNWAHLAQDKDKWQGIVENLRFFKKSGIGVSTSG
jgi:hypothetical protein